MAERSSPDRRGALSAELSEQAAAVVRAESGDAGDVEGVHETRVSIRRLRSALRVFEPLLVDPSEGRLLDAELRWLAELLGGVRDRQVQRKRFADTELDIGFLDTRLYDEQARCEKALRRALRGRRFQALRTRLVAWSERPPVRGESATALEDCAREAARKARSRLRGAATDVELHRARKAAKRARYAAEMLGHRNRAARFRQAQDLLGELQDTVVAADMLRRLTGGATPEQSFVLGALYGRELERRDQLRREARALTE